jgi:hypothetical protein
MTQPIEARLSFPFVFCSFSAALQRSKIAKIEKKIEETEKDQRQNQWERAEAKYRQLKALVVIELELKQLLSAVLGTRRRRSRDSRSSLSTSRASWASSPLAVLSSGLTERKTIIWD